MKYYIDFEFIEGFKKPIFGKTRHFIDLISVGIVCEDGRTYYAVSSEYDFNDADDWVKSNVIEALYKNADIFAKERSTVANIHKFIGKTRAQIAKEIKAFVIGDNIEFYGYYADYDWVLFCSLFGRMIDLPKGFPYYCRDLKQSLDELCASIYDMTGKVPVPENMKGYPLNTKEHIALFDAQFNKDLHDFILLNTQNK